MKGVIIILVVGMWWFSGGVGQAQTPVPSVPSLSINPISYDAAQNRYQVPLTIVNPALIGWLQVQVINSQTQTVVFGPTRYAVAQVIQLPADALQHQESYILYIQALNVRAEPIIVQTQQYGSVVEMPVAGSYSFTHLAPNQVATLQIVAVDFDPQAPAFWVTVNSQINPPPFQYEVWLQNQDTGLRQTIHTLTPNRDNRLKLPVTGVANGKYIIVVNAQNENRQSLAMAQYQGVVLDIQPDPLAFLRTPVSIIGIVVILLMLIVLFVRATRQPKRQTYMPIYVPPPPPPTAPLPTRLRQRTLVILNPLDKKYASVTMTFAPFTIGREKTHWIIPDERISRHHATLFISDGQYFIQDANSANGTFVNGSRLVPQQRYPLASGDVVKLGDVIQFQVDIQNQ